MSSESLWTMFLILAKRFRESWNPFHREAIRQKLIRVYALYKVSAQKEIEAEKGGRKYWVRPIFTLERRHRQGVTENLAKEMEMGDNLKYINYFRMPPTIFQALFEMVAPIITKQHVVRDPIPPETRLQITLRYLASGDSMKSISYSFRVAHNTVSKIIPETCNAIWDCLKQDVFLEDIEERWKDVANKFNQQWNFPNCIGAIDGKHITIQAPPHSGSVYYNYKGHHSINLLAISNADYTFTMVDIGAEGRRSDGGVFSNSTIGQRFRDGSFNLPEPRQLERDGPVLPYPLVADEAFPLTTFMLRPYPRSRHLDMTKKVFNYRLSRARRVVESAFGILAARWRIYRRPILASLNHTVSIVKATVLLHNFVIMTQQRLGLPKSYQQLTSEDERQVSAGMENLPHHSSTCTDRAVEIRNAFAAYFESSGALPFQWEKALRNDF